MLSRNIIRKISVPFINLFIKINLSDLIVKSYRAKHLKFYGISVVKDFFKKDLIPKNIEKEIDNILEIFDKYEKVKSNKKLDAFSSGDYKNKSFKILRKKPIRKNAKYSYSGYDEGLIDVFNPQLKLDKNHWLNIIYKIARQKFERNNILPELKIQYTHSNLYIYRNVNSPRCLHFDSYKKQYKLFIALNPSFSKDRGCYCFIPFSHKFPLLLIQYFGRFINTIRGYSDLGFYPRTDSTLFNIKNALPLVISKGDSFITCQAGVHGDSPSVNPSNRYILVLNYSGS